MEEVIMGRKDLIVMKLLHYFITQQNYTPIILQGAEDEIWLENMNTDNDYKIIRIVSNYLHNDEQLDYDLFKAKKISSKIGRKVFTYNINILSIYTDLGDNVHLENTKKMDLTYIYEDTDIEKNSLLTSKFPDIIDKLTYNEEGLDLFIKITNDINKKNQLDMEHADQVFKQKKPIITYILMAISILIFFIPSILNKYDDIIENFCLYGPYIRKYGEYYRLVTAGFLHADFLHITFNMYALYVIGSQMESYLGKVKYPIIYFFSMILGNLVSITFSDHPSLGASGAIFGLMGSMLYFGYHYRVYLGTVLKSQIIPLILINLGLGFAMSGIDNAAHIGGLIGGFLMTSALGVKYKSSKQEIVNGSIITLIFTAFMIYMAFFMNR